MSIGLNSNKCRARHYAPLFPKPLKSRMKAFLDKVRALLDSAAAMLRIDLNEDADRAAYLATVHALIFETIGEASRSHGGVQRQFAQTVQAVSKLSPFRYLLAPYLVANGLYMIAAFPLYHYFLGNVSRFGNHRLLGRFDDFDGFIGPVDIADVIRIGDRPPDDARVLFM
jgi:hypothetical protein